MASNICPDQNVEKLVKDIISKHNWKSVSDIKYQQGSTIGDGYFSKTIAVDVISAESIFHLFLKCAPNIKSTEAVPLDRMYGNEIYFYDVIYPVFRKFMKDHCVDDGFRHIPTCYGALDKTIIALENIKAKGFSLFDREKVMNDSHIRMVLKTLAKFHAISFALKDQDEEAYDKLTENVYDLTAHDFEDSPFAKMFGGVINDFIAKLDPVEDKDILDELDVEDLVHSLSSPGRDLEYTAFTHGDCWCNNMMFAYKEADMENPIDIMMLDWQVLRSASPVFDLSFFLFTSASEESLSKLQQNLKIYHEELSQQIRQMGSDPDVLYPFEIMKEKWKKHCKFGLTMAFNHIKAMLASKGETLDVATMDFDNVISLYPKFQKEKEYITRMKFITRFMIKYDYL